MTEKKDVPNFPGTYEKSVIRDQTLISQGSKPLEEPVFHELDNDQVGDDKRRQNCVEDQRKLYESEKASDHGEWQDARYEDNEDRAGKKHPAWSALVKRYDPGPDDKYNKRLGTDRFNEPRSLEK